MYTDVELNIRSRQYHPDRSPNSGEIFIYLRKAYEGLSDPITRFAYDRFGPDAVEWKAATYREYMRQGIMQSAGFYMTSAGIMLFLKSGSSAVCHEPYRRCRVWRAD
jgi:DnaJ-class molecular chaperone